MDGQAGRFVVMGVSGVGKTQAGLALAGALGARFVEGDDLHPEANRALMAAGTPLTDRERWPWLDIVGAALAEGRPPVIGACSALARRYRDRLRRHAPDLVFLHLRGEPRLIGERLGARQGHFMPPALLGSQFAALEPMEADEAGIVVDVERPPEEVLEALLSGIARL